MKIKDVNNVLQDLLCFRPSDRAMGLVMLSQNTWSHIITYQINRYIVFSVSQGEPPIFVM